MQQHKCWIVARRRGERLEVTLMPELHASRDTAEFEAERLAIKEGLGAEFVVLESMLSVMVLEIPIRKTYHVGPEF